MICAMWRVLRFESRLRLDGNCLVFTGSTKPDGHGTAWTGEKSELAHRFAYAIANNLDEMPESQILHHPTLCKSPACCNPWHLREGSHYDNMKDLAISNAVNVKFKCGHERIPDNTLYNYVGSTLVRRCRICRAKQSLASYYRNKS